jgi:hypothetical protein
MQKYEFSLKLKHFQKNDKFNLNLATAGPETTSVPDSTVQTDSPTGTPDGTDVPTDAPTDAPTEAPTDVPEETDAPTDEPETSKNPETEAPTDTFTTEEQTTETDVSTAAPFVCPSDGYFALPGQCSSSYFICIDLFPYLVVSNEICLI